ncbi:carboxylating nicotinate-nucleotide diphosphorylase [Candidatus Peregrinibacteria bacterium]|nr:carboxylating nicotinate-nucleotide diphosphorylase [Candidatus Peregrinibacteria bacterium]
MNRKILRELTHNAYSFLSLENSLYKQWVFRYTFLEMEKDLGTKGDVTTNSLFPQKKDVKAKIIARDDGVLAGIEEVKYFLVDSNPDFKPKIGGSFKVEFNKKDGDFIKKGDVIMGIEADVHDLLTVERVVLNLMMRMSGVATFTHEIVGIVKNSDVLIVPTRKTLWGLLDKRAVLIGGGGTHRLNLSDAILIKDTHLDVLGHDFDKALDKIVSANLSVRFVEIEVSSGEDALKCSESLNKYLKNGKLNLIGAILFDNLSVKEVAEIIENIRRKGFYDEILFESSGGITEKNVLDYAKTGVDIISMGCLTNEVSSLDMTMKIDL